MSNLTRTADYLADSLEAMDFIIMSKKSGEGLPLVAWRLKPDENREWDEFALAHKLRARGWVVPAYTMAPHTDKLKMLRVVVREDFTKNRCDALIVDIKLCIELLDSMDKESIKKHQEFLRKHSVNSAQASHNHHKFKVSWHIFRGSISVCIMNRFANFQTEREALHPGQARQDSRCVLESLTWLWTSIKDNKVILSRRTSIEHNSKAKKYQSIYEYKVNNKKKRKGQFSHSIDHDVYHSTCVKAIGNMYFT